MARLVSAHARPIAGGVETLMHVSGDADPVNTPGAKVYRYTLEDGLQWAGAAALLGSKKPLFWGILGTLMMPYWRNR